MTATAPTILATCGGLVAGEWTDAAYGPLLFEAIRLARVPEDRRPKVLHVNTAGGDQRFVEGQEVEAARAVGVDASHLRFFPRRNVPSLREAVFGADVVWVSGGSLVALLAVWRAHGLDDVLRDAWQAGVVLAGGSAGGICWHTGGVTTSFGPDPVPVADGLGFLPGSLGVHIDSDARRLPAFRKAIEDGVLVDGIAIDEGVGLGYRDRELVEAVSERPGGRAIRISQAAPDEALTVRTLREDSV
ncbi:MAG TPA: peptidase E [Pseudonocardiaceae bacterium]|jgi:peptidase E